MQTLLTAAHARGAGASPSPTAAAASAAASTPTTTIAAGPSIAFSAAAAATARARIVAPGTVAAAPTAPSHAFTNPFATGDGGGEGSGGAAAAPSDGVRAFFSAPREVGGHLLVISYALPPLLDYYWSRPEEALSFSLGHEAEGSVLAALKAKGWATELSAGVERGAGASANGCGSTFTVSITATAAGIRAWREAITLVCSYVVHVMCGGVSVSVGAGTEAAVAPSPTAAASSRSGVSPHFPLHCPSGLATIGGAPGVPGPFLPTATLAALHTRGTARLAGLFPEIAAMCAVRYHAIDADAEEDGALESVTKIAAAMVSGAADAHVLDGGALLGPWAAGAVTVLLAHLSPAHMRVDVQSVAVVESGLVPATDGASGSGGGGKGAAAVPASLPSLITPGEAATSVAGVEKWFSTPYVAISVEPATLAAWAQPPVVPHLHLPLPNPYLPTTLELKPLPQSLSQLGGAAAPVAAGAAASQAPTVGSRSTRGKRAARKPSPSPPSSSAASSASPSGAAPAPSPAPSPIASTPPRELLSQVVTVAAAAAASSPSPSPMLATRLWFKQDDVFRLPRTNVRVALYLPVTWAPRSRWGGCLEAAGGGSSSSSSSSSREFSHVAAVRAQLELAARTCADDLSSDLYYAELAEVDGGIESVRNGLLLTVSGLSASVPQLLATMMRRVCGGGGDGEGGKLAVQFARLHESMVRDYSNLHMDVGAAAAYARNSRVLEAHLPAEAAATPPAILAALADPGVASVDGVRAFTVPPPVAAGGGEDCRPWLWASTSSASATSPAADGTPPSASPIVCDMLVHGNEDEASARALFRIVQDALQEAVFSTTPSAAASTSASNGRAGEGVAATETRSVPGGAFDAWYPPADIALLPAAQASSPHLLPSLPPVLADVEVEGVSLSREETNHAVTLYVPLGLDDAISDEDDGVGGGGLPRFRMAAAMLQSLAAEPAFNNLRTQQQLGYSVSLAFRCAGDARAPRRVGVPVELRALPTHLDMPHPDGGPATMTGAGLAAHAAPLPLDGGSGASTPATMLAGRVLALVLAVESASHSPEEVAQRMVAWMCGLRGDLVRLCGLEGEEGVVAPAPAVTVTADGAAAALPAAAPTTFARHIAAFIEEKSAPDMHMTEATDRYWREVGTHRYAFQRLGKEVEALRQMAPREVLRVYDDAVGALAGRVAGWGAAAAGVEGASAASPAASASATAAAAAAGTGPAGVAAVLVKVRGRGSTVV